MYKEIFVIETFSYHGDEISDIVDTFNMVDGIFHHFTGLFTSLYNKHIHYTFMCNSI